MQAYMKQGYRVFDVQIRPAILGLLLAEQQAIYRAMRVLGRVQNDLTVRAG